MRAQGLPQPCIIPLPKATSAAQRPSFQDSAQHSNTPITAASRHASEAPAALAMARLPQPLSDTNLAAHDAALGGHSARRQQPVSELERLPSLSGDGSVTGSVISQSGDRPCSPHCTCELLVHPSKLLLFFCCTHLIELD